MCVFNDEQDGGKTLWYIPAALDNTFSDLGRKVLSKTINTKFG